MIRPKPSEYIKDALMALEECERNPKYNINMDDWYKEIHGSPSSNKKYEVCLAGAVMARRLVAGSMNKSNMQPEFYKSSTTNILYALDAFMCGSIQLGLDILNIHIENYHLPWVINIIPYSEDSEEWKSGMEDMVELLEQN